MYIHMSMVDTNISLRIIREALQDYKGNILQARFKWYARDCDIRLSESQLSIAYRLSVRSDIQVDERKSETTKRQTVIRI